MKILGISGSLDCPQNHDASAALVIDGELIANLEEERLNRLKHSVGEQFPRLAVQKILKDNNLTLDDIDVIAIPHEARVRDWFAKRVIDIIDPNCKKIPEFYYYDHHMGHVCDSFFQSGFDSAVAVIVDGNGDGKDGITIAHCKDNEIKILKKYTEGVSLGKMYYSASVAMADLGEFSEGKFMGLSSYGRPTPVRVLRWENGEIIANFTNIVNEDASLNMQYYLKRNFYPYTLRTADECNILYYIDMAATIQENYNEIFMEVVKYAKELTNEENLILSGGCIQNCIGNNLVVESGLFKNIFAGPAPHDAGVAAGHAFSAALKYGDKIKNVRLKNSYVGQTYSDKEILAACEKTPDAYDENELVLALRNSKVVGWFQGGSEIGPRALGHRSILANPADRDALYVINNYVKHRENWRPLAPIVPAELFDMVFDTPSRDLTEFMLRTLKIRPEWQRKISAVCHIDMTTRPQCLEKEQNPELYSLLMAFYRATGIPCLINTSFNGKNEPIIETPEQAIAFLKRTPHMDRVIFNSKWVVRNDL